MRDFKKIKIHSIVCTPTDKITPEAHELVQQLFHTDGLITNESTLEDFFSCVGIDFPELPREQWEEIAAKQRERLVLGIRAIYGVMVPEILDGDTYIWKVIELIRKRQKKTKVIVH